MKRIEKAEAAATRHKFNEAERLAGIRAELGRFKDTPAAKGAGAEIKTALLNAGEAIRIERRQKLKEMEWTGGSWYWLRQAGRVAVQMSAALTAGIVVTNVAWGLEANAMPFVQCMLELPQQKITLTNGIGFLAVGAGFGWIALNYVAGILRTKRNKLILDAREMVKAVKNAATLLTLSEAFKKRFVEQSSAPFGESLKGA